MIGLLGTLAANLPGWWQLLRQSLLSCERATAARRLIPGNVGGSPSPSCCSAPSVCGGQKPGWAAPLRGRRLAAGHGARPARCAARRAGPAAPTRARPLSARLGVAETLYHLDRTAIAVMALQLAIAAAIGIGVMVSSFRSSVEIWLGQRLAADLYITAPKGWPAARAP